MKAQYKNDADLPLLERLCSGSLIEVIEFARKNLSSKDPYGAHGATYAHEFFAHDVPLAKAAQSINEDLRHGYGVLSVGRGFMLVCPSSWRHQGYGKAVAEVHLYAAKEKIRDAMTLLAKSLKKSDELERIFPKTTKEFLLDEDWKKKVGKEQQERTEEAQKIGASMIEMGALVLDMFLNPEKNLGSYLEQQKGMGQKAKPELPREG